jgi:colicin import membrane protein
MNMSVALYSDPNKVSAGALALLVHIAFFSMLYISFSWQMKPPQGMVVDIWDNLPNVSDEQPQMQQQSEKQERVIAPKVEAAPAVPARAEIELKNKKKLKEEKLKVENAAARKLAEKRADQAERRMDELERQVESRAQAQRKAQEAAAIATGKVVDEYIGKIAAKIRRFIVLPPGVVMNIKAEFNVTLLPSGEVLNASLAKSSGNEPYDSAVERAILKAQPLPLPPAERNMFNRFRDLRLKFSPAESGQ